jgi:hypothetical protein
MSKTKKPTMEDKNLINPAICFSEKEDFVKKSDTIKYSNQP